MAPSAFYKAGADSILQRLGLTNPTPEEESHTLRNVLMGGAAASPFLGLIGERALPQEEIAKLTLRDIARQARAGDIVLTPGGTAQSVLTGARAGHTFPVTGEGRITPVAHGYMNPHGRASVPLNKFFTQMAEEEAVLLRPKTPMTPEQLEKYVHDVKTRSFKPYSVERGARNALQEIFVPKLKALEAGGHSAGDVCSTMGAQAREAVTGERAAIGKASRAMLPTDVLRSPHYDVVGGKLQRPLATSRAARLGARGLMGAGLAGAAYGSYEHPEIAAGAAGFVTAPALTRGASIRHALRGIDPKNVEATVEARRAGFNRIRPFRQLWTKGAPALSHILTRTLPVGLAGGTLAYLGARALTPDKTPPPDRPLTRAHKWITEQTQTLRRPRQT